MSFNTIIIIKNSSNGILHRSSFTATDGTFVISPGETVEDDGNTVAVITGNIAKRKSEGTIVYNAELGGKSTKITLSFHNNTTTHTGKGTSDNTHVVIKSPEELYDSTSDTSILTFTIDYKP